MESRPVPFTVKYHNVLVSCRRHRSLKKGDFRGLSLMAFFFSRTRVVERSLQIERDPSVKPSYHSDPHETSPLWLGNSKADGMVHGDERPWYGNCPEQSWREKSMVPEYATITWSQLRRMRTKDRLLAHPPPNQSLTRSKLPFSILMACKRTIVRG